MVICNLAKVESGVRFPLPAPVEINLKFFFAIVSVLIWVVGAVPPYIRDIINNKTKPHAYTWLIWSITQGTATAVLWIGKGGWATISLLIGAIFALLVFLLSLKYGTRNITKGDTIVLISSLLAIFVWWQLDSPLIAVFMVSIIDVLGYWPSFRKTYEEPWTETPVSWAIFSIANVFNILALSEYNLLTLPYIIAITIANLVLFVICLTRRRVVTRVI